MRSPSSPDTAVHREHASKRSKNRRARSQHEQPTRPSHQSHRSTTTRHCGAKHSAASTNAPRAATKQASGQPNEASQRAAKRSQPSGARKAKPTQQGDSHHAREVGRVELELEDELQRQVGVAADIAVRKHVQQACRHADEHVNKTRRKPGGTPDVGQESSERTRITRTASSVDGQKLVRSTGPDAKRKIGRTNGEQGRDWGTRKRGANLTVRRCSGWRRRWPTAACGCHRRCNNERTNEGK